MSNITIFYYLPVENKECINKVIQYELIRETVEYFHFFHIE